MEKYVASKKQPTVKSKGWKGKVKTVTAVVRS